MIAMGLDFDVDCELEIGADSGLEIGADCKWTVNYDLMRSYKWTEDLDADSELTKYCKLAEDPVLKIDANCE
jgi:hypothetical protein